MKSIINYPIWLITLVIILTSSEVSFGQTEEQKAKFKEEQIAFFTKELQLSDAEAEKFWPLYNDFNNRKMKIADEEKSILNYFHNNSDNMSKSEISESLTKILDISNRRHNLEIDYHNKFKEILPEKKVLQLYVVDRQFRRHIIGRLRHGQGQGRGSKEGGKSRGSGNNQDAPSPISN
jgi:hypothetical protein